MKQELEYTFDPFWGKTAGSLMVQSHRFSHPHGLSEICLLWNALINWLKFKRLVIKSVDFQLEHKWNKHRILQAKGPFPSFAFWSRNEGLCHWSPQTGVYLANLTSCSSTIFFWKKRKKKSKSTTKAANTGNNIPNTLLRKQWKKRKQETKPIQSF